MKAIALSLVTLAACRGGGVGAASEAATSCGAGTHEQMSACVRDTVYQVRAAPVIGADGTTRLRVRALGTHADGTFATDEVVLNTDRAGAGTYLTPALTLGPLGATTYFTPCDHAVAGCLGPLQLTVALASAPTTPVAHAAVMLVDPRDVDPAKPCLGGGNVLHLDGDDTIYTGTLEVTAGTFQMTGFSDATTLTVTPSDSSQGTSWRLEFRTTKLDGVLANYAARYDDAELYGFEDRDHPGMLVDGKDPTIATGVALGNATVSYIDYDNLDGYDAARPLGPVIMDVQNVMLEVDHRVHASASP
jgi:hypothetical protein